jgi:hypothetical protein
MNSLPVTRTVGQKYVYNATAPIADTSGTYTLNLRTAYPDTYDTLTTDDFLICPYESKTTPQASGDAAAVAAYYVPYSIVITDYVLTITGPQVENNYVSVPHRYPLRYRVYLKDSSTVKLRDYGTANFTYNLAAHGYENVTTSDVFYTIYNQSAYAIRYAGARLPISMYCRCCMAVDDNIVKTTELPKVGCNLASQWSWTALNYDVWLHIPSVWKDV